MTGELSYRVRRWFTALDGALAHLGQTSYGPLLLGVVAAGLVCFGVYSIADARFRKT